MLPDFPIDKEKFHAFLISTMFQKAKQSSGILGQVSSTIIHEGNRWRTSHGKNIGADSEFDRLEEIIALPFDELNVSSEEELLLKMESAIQGIVGQMSRNLFKMVSKVTEEAGQVVKTKGKPFIIDNLFEMLEMLEFDFDDQGNPYMPSLVHGPDMKEQILSEYARTKDDPVYKERMEKLIERKRKEYNDRESCRKLVD